MCTQSEQYILGTITELSTDLIWALEKIPETFLYKTQQILKPKWFLSHLAIAFAQSIETRC